jgi:integration host factor subunit alpha
LSFLNFTLSLKVSEDDEVSNDLEKNWKTALTKADLVEAIYEKIGFSKKEAQDLVELVFKIIKDTLSQGEKVKISGFGNFVLRDKNSRTGRNPQTGEAIQISKRRVLTFKPSQVLKEEVNEAVRAKKELEKK